MKFFVSLRKSALLFVIVAAYLYSMPLQLGAAIENVGPYKVEIDVRTSLMKIIPHALVKMSLSGNTIKVAASAPGYVAQKSTIKIKPGVKAYSEIIRLPDPNKRLDALDFNHKPIVSAYFDRFQGSTPTDKYAINMFIPQKGWPHPSPENVKVNQPGYGWPIQETCEISKFADFYKVSMLIDRRVLDDPNDELLIYVNTSEIIELDAAKNWLDSLTRLEENDPYAAHQLAKILVFILPPELSATTIPKTLARLLSQREMFDILHLDR